MVDSKYRDASHDNCSGEATTPENCSYARHMTTSRKSGTQKPINASDGFKRSTSETVESEILAWSDADGGVRC